MKVGIFVPFSWSFWGGVNEHAQHQARAVEVVHRLHLGGVQRRRNRAQGDVQRQWVSAM